MENIETTMSSGVANTIETQDELTPIAPLILEQTHVEDEEVKAADAILSDATKSMQEDGSYDETFSRLADGEFDNEEESEVIREDKRDEENITEITKIEEEIPLEAKEVKEAQADEEREELKTKIAVLEEKVENLEAKNEDLSKRIKNIETTNNVSLLLLLQIAMKLHQMAKEEEDQKKKESLMEFVIKLMGDLMAAMFVPEKAEESRKKAEKDTSSAQKVSSKGSSSKEMDGLIQMLHENYATQDETLTESNSSSSEAPNIENSSM